jgi:methylated-DNA-protein-cysteine methyltransferase-like protein
LPRAQAGAPPFHRLVYRVVRRVPRGKVVTYGQVAAILGQPRGARAVGTALAALDGPMLALVPWQRVINAAGRCSQRDGLAADLQRRLLEREGVRFDRRGHVDLKRVRWAGHVASGRRTSATTLVDPSNPTQDFVLGRGGSEHGALGATRVTSVAAGEAGATIEVRAQEHAT